MFASRKNKRHKPIHPYDSRIPKLVFVTMIIQLIVFDHIHRHSIGTHFLLQQVITG